MTGNQGAIMATTTTPDEVRADLVAAGSANPTVAEALTVFTVAARLSPAPQLVATTHARFSVGANA